MDNDTRSAIKFVLASIILLILLLATFLAGFGSAYLLTGSGVLPTWLTPAPVTVPAATPAPPTATSALEEKPTTTQTPRATQTPLPTPANEDEETFQLFWEVWGLVQESYYGELPSMQEVTYAAIQGLMDALGDDYSAFFEPDIAAIMRQDATGAFEGIGAFVDLDEAGKVIIVGVFENSPAEEAGI